MKTPKTKFLSIVVAVAAQLTPALVNYAGDFSVKLSGFGFTVEINIDGRQEANQPK